MNKPVPPPALFQELALQRPTVTESGALAYCYRLAARYPGHSFSPLKLTGKLRYDDRGELLPIRPAGFYVIWSGPLEGIDATAF